MSDNEFKSQLLNCIEQYIIHFFITSGKSIWILQIADKDTKLWSPNELNIQIALRIIYPYISFRVVSSKHNEKMDNRKDWSRITLMSPTRFLPPITGTFYLPVLLPGWKTESSYPSILINHLGSQHMVFQWSFQL